MSLEIFWLLGLVAIGGVTAIISRSFKPQFDSDMRTARGIVVWGCVLATIWVVYGGSIVLFHAIGK